MEYSIYALRVGSAQDVKTAVSAHLGHQASPQSIRLATTIPISNQGWSNEAVGSLLRLDERGALIGAEHPEETPRILVPWSNVAYLADGLEEI
ncbi:MAG: hypothetical protein WC314_15000 [Vulcanimicrobiota bacterium]